MHYGASIKVGDNYVQLSVRTAIAIGVVSFTELRTALTRAAKISLALCGRLDLVLDLLAPLPSHNGKFMARLKIEPELRVVAEEPAQS